MDITLSVQPAVVQPGHLLKGQIHLAHGSKSSELHLSPLQRLLQARPNTPLPDLSISVKLVGTARLKDEERLIILQASPVRTITNCSFGWESRLPRANLLPSFHRGKLLKCAYFVEVRLEHADKAKFRIFRLPFTVLTAAGVVDLDIPASPFFADWMRLSDATPAKADLDDTSPSVYVPAAPSEPNSMMEERLAELETILRAHLDRLGMKQPGTDWHYEDPRLDDDHADDDVVGVQRFDPEEFRIDFNAERFASLLMSQRQYRPGDLIRGRFRFEGGASGCVFVLVQLVSCESMIENGVRVLELKQIWQEDQIATAAFRSDDFSLSLPFGPDACANFRTPIVELQWQLRFQFAMNRDTTGSEAGRVPPLPLETPLESTAMKERFDVIEWALNLDIISQYKSFEQWSKRQLIFYVRESELAEFQIKG